MPPEEEASRPTLLLGLLSPPLLPDFSSPGWRSLDRSLTAAGWVEEVQGKLASGLPRGRRGGRRKGCAFESGGGGGGESSPARPAKTGKQRVLCATEGASPRNTVRTWPGLQSSVVRNALGTDGKPSSWGSQPLLCLPPSHGDDDTMQITENKNNDGDCV